MPNKCVIKQAFSNGVMAFYTDKHYLLHIVSHPSCVLPTVYIRMQLHTSEIEALTSLLTNTHIKINIFKLTNPALKGIRSIASIS